jgi:hypothetical protein
LEAYEGWETTNTLLFGSLLGAGLELPLTDLLAPLTAGPPALVHSPAVDTAPATPALPTLDLLARNWQPATPLDGRAPTRSAAPPAAGTPAADRHDPWADPFGIFVGFGAGDDPATPAHHAPAAPTPQPPVTGAAPSPVAFRAESAAAPGPQGASAGPMAAAAPIIIAPAGRAAARDAAPAPRSSGAGGSVMTMDDTGGGGGAVMSETALLVAPGDQEVEVMVTVSVAGDHFLWQYDLHNLSYVGLDESDPSTGDVAHFFVRSSMPGTTDAANTIGWFDSIDAPTPDHDGTWNVIWGANDKTNLLPPGESGTFTFTTPVCGIGHVNAEAGEADDNFEALGQVLGPVQTPNSVSATLDSYIPVNANNDNGTLSDGSLWKPVEINNVVVYDTGIPNVRDFDVDGPYQNNNADPQLVPMTITWSGANGGTISVNDVRYGTGELKFWSDAKKTSHMDSFPVQVNSGSKTIYVEGVHESLSVGDVSVELTYTDGNGVTVIWDGLETVTPVLDEFTATPAPNPNIYVDTLNPPPPGSVGLIAAKYDAAGRLIQAGMTLRAHAFTPDLGIGFVQNVVDAENGANNGGPGFAYTTNPRGTWYPSLYYVPNPHLSPPLTFPALDSPSMDPLSQLTEDVMFEGDHWITTVDAPEIWAGHDNNMLELIDFRLSFKTYVVATYNDGSLYPLAYTTWQVNFYADEWLPPIGVSHILDPNGVTSTETFTRSNEDPVTRGPT